MSSTSDQQQDRSVSGDNVNTLSSLPSYMLSRTIQTVPEVWREWTRGLGTGPSVQSLEQLYGPAWRPSHRERVMFSRRKVIIDDVYARNSRGQTLEAAVEELELVRCRGKLSLYQLSLLLSKSRPRRGRSDLERLLDKVELTSRMS